MREITSHKINECNDELEIMADEPDPENGNASHKYEISWLETGEGGGVAYTDIMLLKIPFHHGPIKEGGVNGITDEALLAILIDRLEGFGSGPFDCSENRAALSHLYAAKTWLEALTKNRVERGVEGTNTP